MEEIRAIREATSRRWNTTTPEERVTALNRAVRGWANYFNQGPVLPIYKRLQFTMEYRLRRWLVGKFKQRGAGCRKYPNQYLYEKLGLYKLPTTRADLLRSKACHSG